MKALTLRNLITDHIRDLDPVPRLTLHVLARFADATTLECYPSQETIADCVGVSDRTVRTALAALKERGLIAVVGHRKVTKPGVPRAHVLVYRIMLDDRKPTSGSQLQRPEAHFRPSTSTTGSLRHDDRKQASADDRKPTSDKQITENRSENRSPRRARAREGARPGSFFGGDARELADAHADAWHMHRGERPLIRDEELRAATRLLKTHDATKAKALVENAVALSVTQRVKGNASLIAIAADPTAFMAKPVAAKNGLKQHAPAKRQPWQEDPAE